MQALAGKLTEARAQQALDILQAMRGTTMPDARRRLAEAVRALLGKLTDEQAHQALDAVLQSMRGTALRDLRETVQTLPVELTDEQVQQALRGSAGDARNHPPVRASASGRSGAGTTSQGD